MFLTSHSTIELDFVNLGLGFMETYSLSRGWPLKKCSYTLPEVRKLRIFYWKYANCTQNTQKRQIYANLRKKCCVRTQILNSQPLPGSKIVDDLGPILFAHAVRAWANVVHALGNALGDDNIGPGSDRVRKQY